MNKNIDEMTISGFSYDNFEKKCPFYTESQEDQSINELLLSSDIAKSAGYCWEDYVYEYIEKGNYSFFENAKPQSILDGEVITEVIKAFIDNNELNECYIKQSKLCPAKSFINKEKYIGKILKEKKNITLKPGNSDLIYLYKDSNGVCNICICDIKAALKIKLYHKVQVEIYYEFLESMLEDAKLSDQCILNENGYVWTRATDHPESFERKSIQNYLFERVQSDEDIESETVNDVLPEGVYYMNPKRCEGCIYIDKCIGNIRKHKMELILSPGIGEKDVIYLAKNKNISNAVGMKKYIFSEDNKTKDDGKTNNSIRSCRFFNRMFIKNYKRGNEDYNELRAYLDLLLSDDSNIKYIKKMHETHPDFSTKCEDVQIFLTAQYEQFSNTIPVFAIYVRNKSKKDEEYSFIAKNITPEKIEENFGNFVKKLSEILIKVNTDEKTVQGFVEDGIEKYCIEKALYEYVNRTDADKVIKRNASLVLTWLRSEKTLGHAPNVGYITYVKGKTINDKDLIKAQNKLTSGILQIVEIVNKLYLFKNEISNDLSAIYSSFIADSFQKDTVIFNRFTGNVRTTYLYEMYYDTEKNSRENYEERNGHSLSDSLMKKLRAEKDIVDKIISDFNKDKNKLEKKEAISDKSDSNYTLELRKQFVSSFSNEAFIESDYIDRLKYMLLCEISMSQRQIRESRLHSLQEGFIKNNFIRLKYVGEISDDSYTEEKPIYNNNHLINTITYTIERDEKSKYIKICKGKKDKITKNETTEIISRYGIGKGKNEIIPNKNGNIPKNEKYTYLFKADPKIKKLFKSSALISEKDFYSCVPMWNEIFPKVSSDGASIVDISYFKTENKDDTISNRYYWLKNKESSLRTNYLLIEGQEDIGKFNDSIVFMFQNYQNDLKILNFLYMLQKDKKLKEKIDKLLACDMPNKSGAIRAEKLFEEDPDKQTAYIKFLTNKVSAVIGPPGTGKTYFLSILLKSILRNNKKKNLRILLTSNSWAAIDNMKCAFERECKEENNFKHFDIENDIIRLDANNRKNKASILNDSKNHIDPIVLCTTFWQIYNMCYDPDGKSEEMCKNLQFDVIIIDESTQMRLVDSLILLSCLKSDGKLLVVGDDDQLGSIIRGKYDIPADKEDYYSSVFRYFYSKLQDKGAITQLNQCRRMNQVITRYLANTLYGDYYITVGNKKTGSILTTDKLNDRIESSNIINEISSDGFAHLLDSSYQLTVCYVENADFDSFDINDVEIALTADLVVELQKNTINKENIDKQIDFNTFWGVENKKDEEENEEETGFEIGEGMIGIISPYNRLNEDIQEAVTDRYDSLEDGDKKIFGIPLDRDSIYDNIKCATVDKFQGQERDIIITCYGERDVDSLLLIKDFVYNSNRLNVAMSRAKKKCIIIMSDNLAKRHQECYEDNNERVIKGSEFICCLKDYMKEETPSDEFGEYKQRDYYFDYMIPNKEEKNTGKRKKNEKQESDTKDKKVRIHVYQKGYNPKQTE